MWRAHYDLLFILGSSFIVDGQFECVRIDLQMLHYKWLMLLHPCSTFAVTRRPSAFHLTLTAPRVLAVCVDGTDCMMAGFWAAFQRYAFIN